MKQSILYFTLLCMMAFISRAGEGFAQSTLPVGIDSVVVFFDAAPDQIEVTKTPFQYNKDFALSFQMDDALADIYNIVYPLFEGENGAGGMYYSDGCGQLINFKMSIGINVFSSYSGVDILDPDDPYHDPSKLTWPQLVELYQSGWGIENHGVFDNPQGGGDILMNYQIRRTSSYSRRMVNDSLLMKEFIIPNGIDAFVPYVLQNNYQSVIDENSDPSWLNWNNIGIDVEHDSINWESPKKLNRYFDTYYNPFVVASNFNQAAQQGQHLWVPWGMHNFPGSFTSDFENINQDFGSSALDNILITTEQDIVDYQVMRQLISVQSNIAANKLTITFEGNIPTNRNHYLLTLKLLSNNNIISIEVYGGGNSNFTGVGSNSALINLRWDGREYTIPEIFADSFSNNAMASQSEYDALVAMDYVLLMDAGEHRDSLRQSLCGLNQSGWIYGYDDGFCDFLTIDLGPDTSVCRGSCIQLTGPAGMTAYTWTMNGIVIGQNQVVNICPDFTSLVSLQVQNSSGELASDELIINVLRESVFTLGNDTSLCNGNSILLEGPAPPVSQSYLYQWSTGETAQSIIVSPTSNTDYDLTVTNQSGCESSDTIEVFVHSNPIIDSIDRDPFAYWGHPMTMEVVGSGFNHCLWSTGDTTFVIQVVPTVPDTIVSYDVSVQSDYGCEDDTTILVQVLGPIVFDLGNDTTIYEGNCVTLTGPNNMAWYQWVVNNALYSTSQSILTCPQVTTDYILTVGDGFGNTGSDSITISVLPPINFNLGPDTTIHIGNCLDINGPSNMTTYTWYVADTIFSTNQVISPCPIDTTQYKLVVGDGFSTASDSITVFVISDIGFDLGPDTTLCNGDCMWLYGPENMSVYQWFVADTIFNSTPQVEVCPDDTTQYTLVVIDSYGQSASDSITLFILPSMEFSLGNDTTICLEDSLLLSGPIPPDSLIYHYEWSTGDTTRELWVYGNQAETYTLTAINDFECTWYDEISISVSEVPFITSIVGDTAICPGAEVALEVQGTGIESYLWSTGDSTQIIHVTPPGQDTLLYYRVSVFNGFGCSDTDSIGIHVFPETALSFYQDTIIICEGTENLIEINATTNIHQFHWQYSGLDSITILPELMLAPPLTNSTIYVLGTGDEGCLSLDSAFVRVDSVPELIISSDTTICLGDSVELFMSGGERFFWVVDGDTLSTLPGLVIYPTDTTEVYAGTAYSTGDCFRDTTIMVYVASFPQTRIIADTNTVCVHSWLTLIGEGADNYLWLPIGVTEDTIDMFITDTVLVRLEGSNQWGCKTSDSLEIFTLPSPEVLAFGLFPAYCQSDPGVSLTGVPEGGSFSGTGMIGNSFEPQIAGPGDHYVIYSWENEFGCIGYDSLVTTVYGGGQSIDLGPDTTIFPNDTIILDAGPGFDSYYWNTGAVTQTILVVFDDFPLGTYPYQVMGIINGCTSTGTVNLTFRDTDGVVDQGRNNLIIYPNPTTGQCKVILPQTKGDLTLLVFDQNGNRVISGNVNSCSGQQCQYQINMTGLPNGLYTVLVLGDQIVYRGRVMLIRSW